MSKFIIPENCEAMKNYYSKIFWHFTGGPDLSDLTDEEWKDLSSPNSVISLRELRPMEEAWDALKSIIESRELWATSFDPN